MDILNLKTVLAFSLFVLQIVLAQVAYGFTVFPSKNLAAGQTIYLLNPIETNYYSVFWVNAYNPNEDSACAYISGSELLLDNDLSHYGTCFTNDTGIFKIVELNEAFAAAFTDSKQSPYFVSVESFSLTGYFPVPGMPRLDPAERNDVTSKRRPAFSVPCSPGYIVNVYSDNMQISSGSCPASGFVLLTANNEVPYGLQYITAKHLDTSGALSIASEGLPLTEIPRNRRLIFAN